MKRIFIPLEKISKQNRTVLILVWIVLLIVLWFAGTAGEKHLFPNPAQVAKGFSDLYNEGLVTHIFHSLQLCFISISLAIIVSLFFAYQWPVPVMKPVSEFITKLRFLPFHRIVLLYHFTCKRCTRYADLDTCNFSYYVSYHIIDCGYSRYTSGRI